MTKRIVVVFFNQFALLLSDVKRKADGTLISGWVINGSWRLKIVGQEHRALDGVGNIVNTWVDPKLSGEFEVPDEWQSDYNEIIHRARRAQKSKAN